MCHSRARASPWTGCGGGGTSRETTNQDRAVAAWPMPEGDAYLAVFDGHGVDGHLIASFVSERLAELLLHSPGDLSLSQQLLEANEQLRASAVPSEWSGAAAMSPSYHPSCGAATVSQARPAWPGCQRGPRG